MKLGGVAENIKITYKTKDTNDIPSLIHKKIIFFQHIIQKTCLFVHKNKVLELIEHLKYIQANVELFHAMKEALKTVETFFDYSNYSRSWPSVYDLTIMEMYHRFYCETKSMLYNSKESNHC